MQKKVFIVLVWICWAAFVQAQSAQSVWVDSVFNTLDLNKKIGQLLVVPVNVYNPEEIEKAESWIKNFKIGGIVFTGGGPVTLANVSNHFQHHAQVPLLMAMNSEEGLGSTLDSTIQFIPPLMLGAIKNDSLLYFLGSEIGRQSRALGINLIFTPTADLSTSFENEQLLYSTYGSDTEKVTLKLLAIQSGLHQRGVLTVAKHYPPGGITVQRFQKGKPVIQAHDNPDNLYPLQKLTSAGTTGIATAYEHNLIFPSRKNLLYGKKKIISTAIPTLYSGQYLKQQLNYTGLIFSFIPDIHELNKKFRAGDAEVFAFKAGNDVLMFPENAGATIRKMRRTIRKNAILQKQLDESVRKILAAKFQAGLHRFKKINTEKLYTHLNPPEAWQLHELLLKKAVTVVRNDSSCVPIQRLENTSFASLSISQNDEGTFTSYLSRYTGFNHFQFRPGTDTVNLFQTLQKFDYVIAGIFPSASSWEADYQHFINKLNQHSKVIIVEFGSPAKISLVEKMPVIVQAYTDNKLIQKIIPQILFGGISASGRLPLSVTDSLVAGKGIQTGTLDRFEYASPEAAGMNSVVLEKISAIAWEAIEKKATPGCQILVAKNGKIVYEKSFGWQTYDNQTPISDQTIFDLASISKVAGTLQAVMFLEERGLIDIYKKASVYLPELAATNKKDLIIKDILTHQAGLQPFIPMWPQTVRGDTLLPYYYASEKNDQYPLQVAPGLFVTRAIRDSAWQWVMDSKLIEKAPRTPYPYRYSDLSFMIMHRLVEKLINQPLEDFLAQNLYEPLGAETLGYLPLTRFSPSQIAPTEKDTTYRKAFIVGTVHDERAAMLGGVAGHAGLFGNSIDLLKVGQMLLQKGSYGGQHYYKPETVELFADRQFEGRRGLGWDKPVLSDWNTPTSYYASPRTFGHTGFTGTCMWIDPEFNLVYIFLSNSRFPNRNSKLISLNIRSRIQDVIYRSIFENCQYENQATWSKLK